MGFEKNRRGKSQIFPCAPAGYVKKSFRMAEIEKKRADQKAESEELANQKKQLKVKLDVLSNIHAKRDVKVRQDLAKEQELRANLGKFDENN